MEDSDLTPEIVRKAIFKRFGSIADCAIALNTTSSNLSQKIIKLTPKFIEQLRSNGVFFENDREDEKSNRLFKELYDSLLNKYENEKLKNYKMDLEILRLREKLAKYEPIEKEK